MAADALRTQTGRGARSMSLNPAASPTTPKRVNEDRDPASRDMLTTGMPTPRPAPPPPRTSEAPRQPVCARKRPQHPTPEGQGRAGRAKRGTSRRSPNERKILWRRRAQAPQASGPFLALPALGGGVAGHALRAQTGRGASSTSDYPAASPTTPKRVNEDRVPASRDILTTGMQTSRSAPPPPRTSEAPRSPGRGGGDQAVSAVPPSGGRALGRRGAMRVDDGADTPLAAASVAAVRSSSNDLAIASTKG